MWVLVVLMFNGMGDFRISTNQIIYFEHETCLIAKSIQDQALETTKPTPQAHFQTHCFKFPETKTI